MKAPTIDTAKLRATLTRAHAIALEANKGDDGGTCNFDTCERGLDPLFVTAKARRR